MSFVSAQRHRGSERGSLTPAVVIIMVLLLPLGALVADAGRQINAKLKAQALAEEAARAGATYVRALAGQTTEPTEQSKNRAEQAVQRYCDLARKQQSGGDVRLTHCDFTGIGYGVHSNGQKSYYVKTAVTVEVDSSLLGLLGISELTATGEAQAFAVRAIRGPGKDPYFGTYSPPTPSVSYPPFTLPISTGDPSIPKKTIIRPSRYPTVVCGSPITPPLTIAVSCIPTRTMVTVTKTVKNSKPPPPSVRTTMVSPSPTTVWTTSPTSATPPGW